MQPENQEQIKKLETFHADPQLAIFDELESMAKSLKGLADAEIITVKGKQGEKGEKGDRGEKGDIGIQGKQGIQGVKGEKGAKGDRGETVRGVDGKDGEDGRDGVDGKDGRDGKDGKNGDITTVELKNIKGYDKVNLALQELYERKTSSYGVNLWVNGVDKGTVSKLILTGSGLATTVDSNGAVTVVVTGGSGATLVETPSGTVDGTNLSFVTTQIPLYLISDGVSRFETIHYTRSGFNITFIDGNQPRDAAMGGYIRNIYSA